MAFLASIIHGLSAQQPSCSSICQSILPSTLRFFLNPQKRLFLITELVERRRSHALARTHALMLKRTTIMRAHAHTHADVQSVRIVQQEHYAKPKLTDDGDGR